MSESGMPEASKILNGPGLIRKPGVLAGAVDGALADMVNGLESVADCRTPEFDLPEGMPPDMRLERFCDALSGMGRPLMSALAACYRQICAEQRFDSIDHRALLDQRAQLLCDYLLELARVHGVAFATEGHAPSARGIDTALGTLQATLMAAYGSACHAEGID